MKIPPLICIFPMLRQPAVEVYFYLSGRLVLPEKEKRVKKGIVLILSTLLRTLDLPRARIVLNYRFLLRGRITLIC